MSDQSDQFEKLHIPSDTALIMNTINSALPVMCFGIFVWGFTSILKSKNNALAATAIARVLSEQR